MKKFNGLVLVLFLAGASALAGGTTTRQLDKVQNSTGGNSISVPNGGSSDSLATLTGSQIFGSGSTWNGQAIGAAYGGAGTPTQQYFTLDGSTTAFTLAHTPGNSAGVSLYRDGVLLRQGTNLDYTISGTGITLASAGSRGQRLSAVYTY